MSPFQPQKGDQRGHEHARAAKLAVLIERVGLERPQGKHEKRDGDDPFERLREHHTREPSADISREEVISEGREQDAERDRHFALELGSQHERQELGLVAHLRECNNSGREKQGFQETPPRNTGAPERDARLTECRSAGQSVCSPMSTFRWLGLLCGPSDKQDR